MTTETLHTKDSKLKWVMTIGPDIFIDNRVISKRLINIYKDSDKKIGINYIEK